MGYSSIIQKTCKCGCGKYQTIGFQGYNADCRPDLKEKKLSEQKERQKKANAVNKSKTQLRKLSVENSDVKAPKDYAELDRFFKERMERCEIKCENCGATNWWLENNKDSKFGKLKWRSCQAHLLEKRHFKSIMTHPLNAMVLGSGYSGLCHCHDTYDSSWEKASKMAIWDEVVRRFIIMYPLIKPEEQQYIPDVLLQEINQI